MPQYVKMIIATCDILNWEAKTAAAAPLLLLPLPLLLLLMAFFPGQPGNLGKPAPFWILLEQEMMQ